MNATRIVDIVITLVAFTVSIVLHELAHGLAAYKLGDPTAKAAKRLTLNPLRHIDLFGTIILPLLLALTSPVVFGWAKPVPFNPMYFKNRKQGIMIVGAVGPLTNLTLGMLAAFLIRTFGVEASGIVGVFLLKLCLVNIILGVFNLIPIPPLDGSRVLVGILPNELVGPYLRIERVGFLLIFVLLWLGVLDKIIIPVAGAILRVLLSP